MYPSNHWRCNLKRQLWIWQLWGFAFVTLAGTLLHFLYDWSGEAIYIAPFSGVNESTWEHMKLLFWPSLIYAVFEGFFFRDREDFWCVKLRGILLGILLIPIIFYTYNGVIGKSPDWINIAIFFISAASAFIYETHSMLTRERMCRHKWIPILLLCVIGLAFIIFTFRTPEIGIFRDPITGGYGI